MLKSFAAEEGGPSGLRVKRLRSDQGGEFTGKIFREYSQDQSLLQEFSALYTPQQNGVPGCGWRLAFEAARNMIIRADMGSGFWKEVISTNGIGRMPAWVLDGESPEEAWYGVAPLIHRLQSFGCTAYVFLVT